MGLHQFAMVRSWSRGCSWEATWWQYWLGQTLPAENNPTVIQNVILGIIQSPFPLGRRTVWLKGSVQVCFSRFWWGCQSKEIGTVTEEFYLIHLGWFLIVLFLGFFSPVTDAWVKTGKCRNMEASLNQGTVKSCIKQKYEWKIPDCSWNEEIYSVWVVNVLKQAVCLVLGIAVIGNPWTHPVLSRQGKGSTANRKQQPCAVSGFSVIWWDLCAQWGIRVAPET